MSEIQTKQEPKATSIILNSSVYYYPRAVGLPKKGKLSVDNNSIVLKNKHGVAVFSEPLSSVRAVTRNEDHLYITFTDKKFRFLFGGIASYAGRAVYAGSGILTDNESQSGLNDWVRFFTSKGMMGENLSTKVKVTKNMRFLAPLMLIIALAFVVLITLSLLNK